MLNKWNLRISGGMKRRLIIARALLNKPKLLILDEPTTGVDPVSRREFWNILTDLHLVDTTIVVSTPYMDEAALCDRIALIQDSKILQIDTPEDIVKHYPKTIYDVKADKMYELIQYLNRYKKIIGVSIRYLAKKNT